MTTLQSQLGILPADDRRIDRPYYAREIMPGTGLPPGYLKVFGPDHREIGALERRRALEMVNELNAKDAARAREEAEGAAMVDSDCDGMS